MERIVIIGASYLQLPLILRAKELGFETHVFAWEEGAVAKELCNSFYPISITEKERILEECTNIKPLGIISIASDLAVITVNYVAEHLGLIGNSTSSSLVSTNKFLMRAALRARNLPCPGFIHCTQENIPSTINNLKYPLIVKPVDRSGSRGVTKILSPDGLPSAVDRAIFYSMSKECIVEEFVTGEEISVEVISWQGKHRLLAITDKITTGAPNFVETGHTQPSKFALFQDRIRQVVFDALDALGVLNGASHSELLIGNDGKITIVEVGARMGGDFIGAKLVELSTGFDFLKAVIYVCLGKYTETEFSASISKVSGVRYLVPMSGTVTSINVRPSEKIMDYGIQCKIGDEIEDIHESADRKAFYVFQTCLEEPEPESPIEIITSIA